MKAALGEIVGNEVQRRKPPQPYPQIVVHTEIERRVHIGDAPDRVMAKEYRRLTDEAGLREPRDAKVFRRIRCDYLAAGVRVIPVTINTRRVGMRAQRFDGALDSHRKV